MAKEFNVTGICRPAKHYMADITGKLAQTFKMVEKGDYFVISKPRQYGKTTLLYCLTDLLQKKGGYLVFNVSFEGVGDSFFSDEKNFCRGFLALLADYAKYKAAELAPLLNETSATIKNMRALSVVISEMTLRTDKKMVLLIDEVDKSSDNQLFISKIWRGKEAHEDGLLQLADYLDRLSLAEGYLIIFDHSKKKTWKSARETADGKKVFSVWV